MAEHDDDQIDPNEPEGIRNLREANKRLKDEADAGRRAQRELAFVKAGITTDSGTGKLLFDAYTGDLTSDAIKTAAIEYGVLSAEEPPAPPTQTEEPPAPDPNLEQTQRRSQLGAESIDPALPPTGQDVVEKMYGEFHELRAQGESREDASVAVLGSIFQAARDGDERFIFDAASWQGSEAAKAR